jgi:cell division protein FtsW (lipid II flippase)
MMRLQVGPGLAIYVVAASVVGLATAARAGAPLAGLAVQGVILAIFGWFILFKLRPLHPANARSDRWLALAFVLAVGLCFMVGPEVAGVRRWIAVGPYLLQPAILLIPVWTWHYARGDADPWVALALGGVAVLVALQPDVAAAAALAGGLAVSAISRRQAPDVVAVIVALAGLLWALTRFDPLLPLPHVEQAAETAFNADLRLGLAAWTILLTLPLPFLLLRRRDIPNRALAASWAGLVAASLFGNYPEPIVGYSASLAAAWMLSIEYATRSREEPEPA